MTKRILMEPEIDISRREFVTATGSAGISVLSGCTGGESDGQAPTAETSERDGTDVTTRSAETTGAGEASALRSAIEREVMPIELDASSENLDTVATRLADAPIVGIGEHSHGVEAFKRVPQQLVRRLVGDHGYRLIAMEGVLGDFESVNAYVTDGEGDIESALSSVEMFIWRTDEIRRMLEWLREFNEGRPSSNRAVVRGYDAQQYYVNATAIRSYLERVDPNYLAEIDDSLESLTTPLQGEPASAYMTDAQVTLIGNLEERMRTHESEYVEQSSRSEWQLAKRHIWTLERGLRAVEKFAAHEYPKGKEIRDKSMADNVAWLREWTNRNRAVVMGSINHTGRNPKGFDGRGVRAGQHLTDEFGSDYYSLGVLFGTGAFSTPANHHGTEFETFELDGPLDDTLEATLATVSESQLYLDFDDARERSEIDTWIEGTSKMQVSVPGAPEKGAIALPEPPRDLVDGVIFVRDVSPASFYPAE